jgi:hypothetical protein
MINYEVTKAFPKGRFLQVKYSKAGALDYYKNFRTGDFSEASINQLVQNGQLEAEAHWLATETLPEEIDISNLNGTLKNIVREPAPAFDPETEVIEQTITETADTITYGYTVRAKTQAELDNDIALFRFETTSTMRQARLALSQQGLLATVQSNIEALPEESQIEWEYAAVVERNSPLVASLGAALGLTETQLDDLFKLAITL